MPQRVSLSHLHRGPRPAGARLWRSFLAGWCCALAGCTFVSHARNADGVALFQQGQYEAAVRKFQQAIASQPDNPDSYYNLAATYHQSGKLSGRREELDLAENYYNQCLDRDTSHSHREAYRGLAVLLAEQDRREEAFRLLEGWTQRNPSAPIPKLELARLHQEVGNTAAAKERLLEALAVDPACAQAHAALGQIHEQEGNLAQALANYDRALAKDPLQAGVASRAAALRARTAALPKSPSGSAGRTAQAAPIQGPR